MRTNVFAIACIILLMCSVSMAVSPNAIPSGSTIYVEPHDGFENYLRAAFQEKSVPLSVVLDKEKADFILTATTERGDKPSWSQTIFLGAMALKKSELYSSLWSSCDELRGGMDASQYRDCRAGQES